MPWLERRPVIEPIRMPDNPDAYTKHYISAANKTAIILNRSVRRDNQVLDAFDQIRNGPHLTDRAKGAGTIFLEAVRAVTSDPVAEIAERIGMKH